MRSQLALHALRPPPTLVNSLATEGSITEVAKATGTLAILSNYRFALRIRVGWILAQARGTR